MSASIISKYINKYKYNTYIKFEFIINNSKTNNDLFIYELNTDYDKYTNLINKFNKIDTWYDITETSYREYIKNNLRLNSYSNGTQICYYKNIIDIVNIDNLSLIIYTNDIAPLDQFENSFDYDYIYTINQQSYLTNNISVNLKKIKYNNIINYESNIVYTPKPGKNNNLDSVIYSICDNINLMNE